MVKRARDEHKAAIEWLNNHTDEIIGFFLVEIKLYQIGDSEPAVKFEVVEQPNDWTKGVKKSTNSSPILQDRYDYWVEFNDYAFKDHAFAKEFNQRKPNTDHWMTFSVGSSACSIIVSQIRKYNNLMVEWYINDDKEMYHKFLSHKGEIEADMGIELEWNELPEKKASRIIAYIDVNFDNKEGMVTAV